MRLAILGRGLIGGSIELRAKELGWKVRWYDPADAESRSFEDACVKAQTIAIAAPLGATLALLPKLARSSARLIVDVASVKVPVVSAGRDVPGFVATHPMAGKERGGVAHAEAGLFAGRPWAYVPSGDDGLDARARDFIEAMGALPFAVDASAHDRALARTSHLPQLLGFVLADRIAELDGELRESASGPVARELLRIATSDRAAWDEIFAANGANIIAEAKAVSERLASFETLLSVAPQDDTSGKVAPQDDTSGKVAPQDDTSG